MTHGPTEIWEALAQGYERDRQRPSSLDTLVEFPAQLEMIGEYEGSRVLDLGCGSGAKAIHLASTGAAEVVGVDICRPFIESLRHRALPPNASFYLGDLNDLGRVAALRGRWFDLVLCFQSFSYVTDPVATLSHIRGLVAEGGALILCRPHPLRFAMEYARSSGVGLARAYQSSATCSYRSEWNQEITLTDPVVTFAEMINQLSSAGFLIDQVKEPQLTVEQANDHPDLQGWMDDNFGVILIRARTARRPPLKKSTHESHAEQPHQGNIG